MIGYRLVIGLGIAAVFVAQRWAMVHVSGPDREILGCLFSLMFLVSVAEFGTLALAKARAGRSRANAVRVPIALVLTMASVLLAVNAFPAQLGGIFLLPKRSPPTVPIVILVGGWLLVLHRFRRRGASVRLLAVALGGLVLGTRISTAMIWPFDRLDGDMLETIDRGLDALFVGRFPYDRFPAAMPYLPGTFLSYAPAKLLGIDLRVTNLACDLLSVVAVVMIGARIDRDERGRAGVSLAAVALPLFMLHPIWVHYGANTQYAPSVLATVMLGLSVTRGRARSQAVALGLAMGTNQMLVACSPVLFAWWVGRLGPAKGLGLAAASAGIFGVMVAPFVAWNAGRFVEIAFLGRWEFPPELMAGRFSLLPIVRGLGPIAGPALSAVAILVASSFAWRARSPEAVVLSMALGLGVAVMLQPMSFSHYLLPVVTLVSVAPVSLARSVGSERIGPGGPILRGPRTSLHAYARRTSPGTPGDRD